MGAAMPCTPLGRRMWKYSSGCQDETAMVRGADVSCVDHKDSEEALVVTDVKAREVKTYDRSIKVNGRAWGVPSAYGHGQCLNCPSKAAPPSLKCLKCQGSTEAGNAMSPEDVAVLQTQ